MKEVVSLLIEKNKKISTMESCTGGSVASAITNIPNASQVFLFGAVTYSNEYKIKMGVDENIIHKYSVYSTNTAREISKKISLFTDSDYGIGVTGQLKKPDLNNPTKEDDKVYISIYDKECDKFYDKVIVATKNTREENKQEVIKVISNMLLDIII